MTTSDAEAKPTPLLLLDIDGTVRKGKEHLGRFVNTKDDVEVFPEAVEQMRRWRRAGSRIAGVSNQGGIALGLVDEAEIRRAFEETDRQADQLFDFLTYCPHHPDADKPGQRDCWCRKPGIGLLLEVVIKLGARHENEVYPHDMMLMVGDRPEDRECAAAAGIAFMWAEDWRAGKTEPVRNPAAATWPDTVSEESSGQYSTFGDFDVREQSK